MQNFYRGIFCIYFSILKKSNTLLFIDFVILLSNEIKRNKIFNSFFFFTNESMHENTSSCVFELFSFLHAGL